MSKDNLTEKDKELADTHFNNYLAEYQDLYDLHTAFFKDKREEDKDNG